MDDRIRILFLAADPSDLTRTRLAAEFQVIKDELRTGKFAHRFDLEAEFSVKIPDLTRAVLSFRPHILHFSGHGSAAGDLCFENPAVESERAGPEDLDAIFAFLAGRVDCVVLNACFSEKQADFVSKHIPYVIGLRGVVTEGAAICFSLGFYQALSAGETIEQAFEVGKALLQAKKLLGCEPILKVGVSRPLAGLGGGRAGSRSRATVTGRDIKAGGGILMRALPGSVEAERLEAGGDVKLEGKALEET